MELFCEVSQDSRQFTNREMKLQSLRRLAVIKVLLKYSQRFHCITMFALVTIFEIKACDPLREINLKCNKIEAIINFLHLNHGNN